jgi:hypothetical protein
MAWMKWVAFGCGGCLLVVVIAAVAMVSCVGYFGQDPQGVEVVVSSPMDVAVGEVFRLDVEVTNRRDTEPFGLTDVDLDEGYLESFTVVRTVPEHKSSMHVPIDNSRSFTFDRPVAPGETAVFTFELRAEEVGSFRGDVDVCEGARFLTKMVQTTVREAGGGRVEAE